MVKQKGTPCKGGIYRITLKVDGRTYIGQTRQKFNHRWTEHLRDFKGQRHPNSYLQRCWNKYGEDAFEFAVLEPVQCIEDLGAAEARWILFYGANQRDRGFNLKGDIRHSVLPSEEHREVLRQNSIKRWADPVLRQKMLDAISQSMATPEYRENASKLSKARWQDPVLRKKIMDAKAYLSDDEEYKRKIGEATLRLWNTPGHRENISKKLKEFYSTPEQKQRMREIVNKAWEDPEYRKRQAKTFSKTQISIRKFDYEVLKPDGTSVTVIDTKEFCAANGLNSKTFRARANDGGTMRNGWKIRKVPRPDIEDKSTE